MTSGPDSPDDETLDLPGSDLNARGRSRRGPALLPRGTRVGRYEVEYLIGTGGLGVVYAAIDPELGRHVALKLLKVDPRPGESGGQDRLLREARALARLSHPNVVAVYDVGAWSDRVFVAMEMITGRDLRGWLLVTPRRPPAVVDVFLAAGRGLAAAHAAGLVHRDFKPDNVLVGGDGRVCVTDFGLARALEEARADEDGAIVGTPAYMAPEQHLGRSADARSDQFGFCASLHEALYGERPFAGVDLDELSAEIIAGRVQPPPRGAHVPATLARIVVRGLSSDPAARWPSMEALLAALGRDRRKLWRRLAAVAAALLAVVVTALAADAIVRARHVAVTRTAFAAARRGIERTLASRYEAFAALAELSTMLPILREVAAARDQAAFGLGSRAADVTQLERLHASLRDADWDAWSAATSRGALAIADYKGRLLYTTGDRDLFGANLRRLPAVAAAYRQGGPGAGSEVLPAADPALAAAGLAGAPPHLGLVLLFARASVLAGVPQAAFIQTIAARRLLEELSPDPELRLGLDAPDGAFDGDLPPALLAAGRGAGAALVEEQHGGRPWLVGGHPVPGLAGGPPIALLVMARRADVGLAGLFPYARAILVLAAGLALVVLALAGWRLRRGR
jgi:hypothetical protein